MLLQQILAKHFEVNPAQVEFRICKRLRPHCKGSRRGSFEVVVVRPKVRTKPVRLLVEPEAKADQRIQQL